MFEKEDWFLGCIGLLAYVAIIVVVSSVCRGWAVATLWGWFIVPKFGLPSLTIAEAIGLGLLAGVLVTTHSVTNTKNKGALLVCIQAVLLAVIPPLLAVGAGWIVFQFV